LIEYLKKLKEGFPDLTNRDELEEPAAKQLLFLIEVNQLVVVKIFLRKVVKVNACQITLQCLTGRFY
jgi:hypothetical protein